LVFGYINALICSKGIGSINRMMYSVGGSILECLGDIIQKLHFNLQPEKLKSEPVVEGNWEKMVSREDFLILNDRLDGKREKYKIENANSARPLNGHIYCSECGSKMVGYEVKKKKLHYYKCLKCSSVSINANTTKNARNEGANDLFLKLLSSYELKELLKGPFKEQL